MVLIRIRRTTSVVGATASVNTGSTIWRTALIIISCRHGESESQASISAKPVTLFTSYSRSKRPETGSQPSVSEKKRVSNSASQKIGIEKPSRAKKLITLSCHLLRVMPASMPTGMPISSAKPNARMHSSMVAGNTSRSCSEISWPLMLDTPKSQCMTPSNQKAQAFHSDAPCNGACGVK